MANITQFLLQIKNSANLAEEQVTDNRGTKARSFFVSKRKDWS